MRAHLAKWFPAYLAGALFLLLQFCLALLHVAGPLTSAQRSSMSAFDWWLLFARVLTVCIPTMLAFLNRSVATALAQPPMPAPEAPRSLAPGTITDWPASIAGLNTAQLRELVDLVELEAKRRLRPESALPAS